MLSNSIATQNQPANPLVNLDSNGNHNGNGAGVVNNKTDDVLIGYIPHHHYANPNGDVGFNWGTTQSDDAIFVPRPRCPQPSNEGISGVEGNTIKFKDGSKLEVSGKTNWKYTDKDGKTTDVWGDPHVVEGDGGKWDFKKNLSMLIGKNIKINVTTTPTNAGDPNSATVTSQLEVMSGNDHVTVSNVDNEPKMGEVTKDGRQSWNNKFSDSVVRMGGNNDWYAQNDKGEWHEITGNDGDNFKLGDKTLPDNVRQMLDGDGINFGGYQATRGLNKNWSNAALPQQFKQVQMMMSVLQRLFGANSYLNSFGRANSNQSSQHLFDRRAAAQNPFFNNGIFE